MIDALIGTRKGLFPVHSESGAMRLGSPSFVGVPVTNTMFDPRDGAWYASLDHGHFGVHLHRSDDQGATWVEIATPEYPPKPVGVAHVNPFSQREVEWTTQLGWVLEPGHPDEPGVIWCGTIPGGLFRSSDRGDSWELNEALWNLPARAKWGGGGFDDAGLHSVAIDPRGAGRIVVGISCGGAWRTDDGGDNWTIAANGMRADFLPPEFAGDPESQDPHRIVRSPSDPDVLWTQHHCGIWRSTDNGDEWHQISPTGEGAPPSTFGFAVAVHPTDADTAWFVPAVSDEVRVPVDGAFVVTRTRDGGETFDVLSDGLPSDAAYDLVYRHGLDVDATGDRLLMGSTTGSLWWSADGGERWQTLSTNLPPIASVRFGEGR